MPTPDPYIVHKPGDLITAEDWNAVQGLIQQDIGTKITKAIGGIKKVDQAGDSGTLDGKSLKEIEDDILKKVFEQLPTRTGYKMIFKVLTVDDEKVIKHDLKAFPLVDVYQLNYFRVVCSEDDQKQDEWVNFYLYHSNEKRFRPPTSTDPLIIESTDPKIHPFKIPFADMLYRYNVKYTEDTSLGDLVTDFWEAFFSDPNDQFDEDQYCHSPWFDRCCASDHSTVSDLKKHGDWDDLWFQVRPVKTINYPLDATGQPKPNIAPPPAGLSTVWPNGIQAPHNILISHFDFDTLGIRLLAPPVYPTAQTTGTNPVNSSHEKVMLLLKV